MTALMEYRELTDIIKSRSSNETVSPQLELAFLTSPIIKNEKVSHTTADREYFLAHDAKIRLDDYYVVGTAKNKLEGIILLSKEKSAEPSSLVMAIVDFTREDSELVYSALFRPFVNGTQATEQAPVKLYGRFIYNPLGSPYLDIDAVEMENYRPIILEEKKSKGHIGFALQRDAGIEKGQKPDPRIREYGNSGDLVMLSDYRIEKILQFDENMMVASLQGNAGQSQLYCSFNPNIPGAQALFAAMQMAGTHEGDRYCYNPVFYGKMSPNKLELHGIEFANISAFAIPKN